MVTARPSVEFAFMTVAMLAKLWHGEAWKAVCLQSERQLSELQQQPRKSILPKQNPAALVERFVLPQEFTADSWLFQRAEM